MAGARRAAYVIDAHEYVAGDPNCDHEDAADHAPCAEEGCGASKDAFVHSEEARNGGYTLTQIEDSDIGYAAEEHARMVAPGPHTVHDDGGAGEDNEDGARKSTASNRRTRR